MTHCTNGHSILQILPLVGRDYFPTFCDLFWPWEYDQSHIMLLVNRSFKMHESDSYTALVCSSASVIEMIYDDND